ncbi:MFS transporter [Microbacterium sp. SORGH_AS_0888]|uniref:MFS transporter n=1 Tax=Microbacterium sp. SORGH_AS_0888 TaxID=3041791 RepID=UPI0027869C28|nr:MFS transporter [Microbacterium sp. SORGH_AS_0888]MDQ1129077.1 MFS family permease [Microbacterium sp. SORGH_AS_0888]
MSTRPAGMSGYAALPRIAGWGYLVATALGRLPMSMIPLTILTLATSATGSIAVGGFAAAAAALGEAVGAPLSGALTDRLGQRPVLLVGVVVNLAVLCTFTLTAGVSPDAVTIALAAAAGLTLPQVGALSRARWLAMAPDDVHTAFAFEGVMDELVYIFGPALVGILAVAAGPHAAVLVAAVLVGVFVTQFAVHRTHRLVPRRQPQTGDADVATPRISARRRAVVMLIAFTGMVAMGTFFGATQTSLTAFAAEAGVPDAGALLYAVMAVGSAATTLSMVLVPERIGPWTRWWLSAAGMLAGSVLMMAASTIPMVIIAGVIAGAFQGPLLLTIFGASGSVTEQGRGGVMMTLTASGVVVGIALGSAVAGALAQVGGSAGGFTVVVSAASVLLLLGLTAAITTATRRRMVREA